MSFFSLCRKPMTEEEAVKKADTYGVSAIENILHLSCLRFLAAKKNETGGKDD